MGRHIKPRVFGEEDYLLEDLHARILELDLSMTEVARRCDFGPANLTSMFGTCRNRNPTLKTLRRVVQAVGLKLVLVEERTS